VEAGVFVQSVGELECFAGALLGVGVIDDEVDALVTGERANDFRVDPWNGVEFAGLVAREVRPGEPGGLVGSQLGRHAEGGGCWLGFGNSSINHAFWIDNSLLS